MTVTNGPLETNRPAEDGDAARRNIAKCSKTQTLVFDALILNVFFVRFGFWVGLNSRNRQSEMMMIVAAELELG